MTLPDERFRSLMYAQILMEDIAFGKYRPVAKHAKEVAKAILLHYPTTTELKLIARKCPKMLRGEL